MNSKAVLASAASALAMGLVAMASSASASTVFDASLAAPGVYYGTGNHNGHFVVDTQDGIEAALRAHIYTLDATAPASDLYSFNLGDIISVDWSINPDVGQGANPTPVAFTNATLSIFDVANNHLQFIPAIFPDVNTTTPLAPGAFQESERLAFSFMDSLYNANQNNTFVVTLSMLGPNADVISLSETIQQGSGAVPEPAAWALMIVGFGGVGAALRRRRQGVAIAAA